MQKYVFIIVGLLMGWNPAQGQKTSEILSEQELANLHAAVEMSYPGLDPICSHDPVKVAPGVATIGVISGPVFLANVEEQALAVNVKGKGIVVISGCGHQTIEKIVLRTEKLFDEPLYGLLGGFHLPVTESRHITRFYRWAVTGKLPWDSLTKEEVEQYVAFLNQRGVRVAGVSGHDSCDWSINAFKQGIQGEFVDMYVGEPIHMETVSIR
jgi:7,8-dihydropterin-6-yl-methyl-4-(beta-D-ribofuranosyl)aminobenzene 5'-phosphate synthase